MDSVVLVVRVLVVAVVSVVSVASVVTCKVQLVWKLQLFAPENEKRMPFDRLFTPVDRPINGGKIEKRLYVRTKSIVK